MIEKTQKEIVDKLESYTAILHKFNFKDEEALGKVASVDTTNIIVDVENIDQLKRLQVNHLAVLQSSRPGQHLIGLITQVTRKRNIGDIINEGVNDPSELNLCRIALIGTMLDRDGERRNVFRRTLESVPEIDANWVIPPKKAST